MMQHQDTNRAMPSLTTRCVQEAEVETVITLDCGTKNRSNTVVNTVPYLCLKILKRQKSVKMKRQRDMPRKRLSEQAIVSA